VFQAWLAITFSLFGAIPKTKITTERRKSGLTKTNKNKFPFKFMHIFYDQDDIHYETQYQEELNKNAGTKVLKRSHIQAKPELSPCLLRAAIQEFG